jgi:predicted ABC-type exoprotein transport system permease subunit
MVGFVIAIMLPYFLIFIHSFVINIVATFLFLFLVSFGLIPLILHVDYQFDKNINKDQYPEIYGRGVYRQGKIELPK